MAGIGLNIKMLGAEKIIKALTDKDTIKQPVASGIKRIALYYEGLVKKATVVDTGRLRSSITSQIGPASATIGTNIQYASFVEYGTQKMYARHMEGGVKVFGKGMFTHALELLRSWLANDNHGIHKDIEARFD